MNTLTLPNGYEAFGLVQSANGKSLYAVYSGGQIYVLNSTSGAVENTVYNVAPCIRSLSYATNGLAIYGFAISCTNADGQLIDTATNTSGTPYPLPALPGDPTASYNQAALPADNDSIVFLAPYASNAVIVNPSNGALIAAPEACYPSQCSLVAAAPNGLNGYFTASDSSAYLYVVSAPSYGVSQQISLDANIPDSFAIYSTNPYGIGINPNSSDVYVSFGFLESGYPTQYALQTVSTSTYTVANTMLFSSPIRGPFAVSPNGKYLYAYSSSQSQYDVIALNNYTIVANIPMPGTPEAIAT